MPTAPVTRDALGIGVAVGAVGISFGVLAVNAGLTPWQAIAMSLLVFTGASQFAAVGVLASGGAVLAAIVPALLLGARNAAYGLVVSPFLRRRALEAQLVIDESTAMAKAHPEQPRSAFLATGLSVYVFWAAGTAVGAFAGEGLADPAALGLDAVFPAAFLALLAPQLRRGAAASAALLGAGIAIVLVPVTPAGIPILASVLALVPVLRRA
jgi:4-azaleucine resistance transporter AzlC